jgi:transcriptional regulator with XRE-family HTH domain
MIAMRKLPAENLIENLRMLLEKSSMPIPLLAQKSGVSKRMIDYILAGERKAGLDVADNLAAVFGISGWQLIMPNLRWEMVKSGNLEELIQNYVNSSEAGREFILSVAEREAKYGPIEGEFRIEKDSPPQSMVLVKNSTPTQGSADGSKSGALVRIQKPRNRKTTRKDVGTG